MLKLLTLLLALILTGCAGTVSDRYYYTWQCPNGTCRALAADHQRCIVETNRHYVPWIAGPGPKQGFYKTCLEESGYLKLGQSETRPTGGLANGTGITSLEWKAR
jgi:hypothetical protein